MQDKAEIESTRDAYNTELTGVGLRSSAFRPTLDSESEGHSALLSKVHDHMMPSHMVTLRLELLLPANILHQ